MEIIEDIDGWRRRFADWRPGAGDELGSDYPFVKNRRAPFTPARRALPMLNLDELAIWAAGSGYQMLEIACWPVESGGRRYGGVSHIDVASRF